MPNLPFVPARELSPVELFLLLRWAMILFFSITPIYCSADQQLERRFYAEAPRAWEQMRELYEHAEGDVTDVLTPLAGYPQDGQFYGHSAKHTFKTAGNNALHTTQDGDHTSVDVLNDEYGFRIHREHPASPWVVEHLGSKKKIQDRLENTGQVLTMGFNLNLQTLPWTIAQKGFKIVGIKEMPGTALVQLTFTSTDVFRDDYRVLGGRIVLDPGHSWRVIEYDLDIQLEVKGKVKGKVEYNAEAAGSCFPSSVTQDFEFSNGIRKQRVFSYTQYNSATVPDREFRMTAFGLAEPVIGKPPFNYGMLAVNTAAIVALAIGIYLRRKRKSA